MADGTSALLSMLGGSDLNQFQSDAQAGNIYSSIAPALLGLKFNESTWDPGTSAAVNFGKAFLGGILGNYGRSQVADQTAQISKLLPSLYSDPSNVENPGVDSSAFEKLKNTAIQESILRGAAQKATQDDNLRATIKSIIGEGVQTGSLSPAAALKIAAEDPSAAAAELSTTDNGEGKRAALLDAFGIKDPTARKGLANASEDSIRAWVTANKGTSDAQKTALETSIRKELQRTNSPYSVALAVSPLLTAAENNIANPQKSGQSDFALVELYNKIINPGGIIRASLVQQTLDAANPGNKIAGELEHVFGGGTFNNDTRSQLIDVIRTLSNDKLTAGKSYVDNYLGIAKNKNIDTSNIIDPDYYNNIFGNVKAPGAATQSAPNIQQQYNALRASGLSPQDAKSKLGL